MIKAIQKAPPRWHAEAAQLLTENFGAIHAAFTDATKRAVWMGMFLNHIKAKGKEDGSIPHGEFMPWLEKNVPDVPGRTARTYMKLADGVCEKNQIQIGQFSQFAGLPGHLPPKIEKAIEGQTQQQLFLSFKNVDENGDPLKAGCAPGKARKLTLAEQAEAERACVQESMHGVIRALEAMGPSFTLATDLDLEAFNGVLMRHTKAINEWLRQPKNRRDPHAIAILFTSKN